MVPQIEWGACALIKKRDGDVRFGGLGKSMDWVGVRGSSVREDWSAPGEVSSEDPAWRLHKFLELLILGNFSSREIL
ncbi:hypothetical protein TNIN_9001 [Trichonephila inaurata madagascariensis]|uniref:Uncharacterized protein n=1 Tax=Trichonephila inaurata madagascariensis TaxID=2747483 RepID=A0A8X6YIE6_9ARAC|nr:hypothetical protein TNIN_9001 [Trichonephila inaurata madagascariensis]